MYLQELIRYLETHPTAVVRVQPYADGTKDVVVRIQPEPRMISEDEITRVYMRDVTPLPLGTFARGPTLRPVLPEVERARLLQGKWREPCTDPDKMHGACDGFSGQDSY